MVDRCYRSTINNIPEDQSKIRNTNIPFFFNVEFEKEGLQTPIVSDPLVRCDKCKAYLNPYVEIIMPGVKWRCNLCENVNEVQSAFVMTERRSNECPQDPIKNTEFNRSYFLREDLRNDIYEIEAPDSFGVKTPDPPVLCFLIDISIEAQKMNLLGSVLNCIKEIIRNADYDKRTKICLIFYNEFAYILNRGAKDTNFKDDTVNSFSNTMTIISGEVPMLLSESFLYSIDEVSKINFTSIEKYFEDKKSVHSNLLLPLKVITIAFRSASVFCFFSTMPNFGSSKIEPSVNLICKNSEYKTSAESLVRKNVSVNLFLMTRYNIEYSTISILSQQTGGQTFHYSNYDGYDPVSSSKLFCDLSDYFSRNIGFGAACRIRASDGTVLKSVYGNFSQKSVDLFGYANWNPSHSINFSVTLFNNVKGALYLQIAMIRVNERVGRDL